MLSLIGKIAALYIQRFDDSIAVAAVSEIEQLTTGLSRKIWRKIILLSQITDFAMNAAPAAEPGSEPAVDTPAVQTDRRNPSDHDAPSDSTPVDVVCLNAKYCYLLVLGLWKPAYPLRPPR